MTADDFRALLVSHFQGYPHSAPIDPQFPKTVGYQIRFGRLVRTVNFWIDEDDRVCGIAAPWANHLDDTVPTHNAVVMLERFKRRLRADIHTLNEQIAD